MPASGSTTSSETQSPAISIWNAGRGVNGTPAAIYFANRHITPSGNVEDALRYVSENGKHMLLGAIRTWNDGQPGPAIAIQRIFLTATGQGTADHDGVRKKSLGAMADEAGRQAFWFMPGVEPAIICEGIEDALAVRKAHFDKAQRTPMVVATLGVGRFKRAAEVFPNAIFVPDNEAGAIKNAEEAARACGGKVVMLGKLELADGCSDANELLKAAGPDAVLKAVAEAVEPPSAPERTVDASKHESPPSGHASRDDGSRLEDVERALNAHWNFDEYEDWTNSALALHTIEGGKDVWLAWAKRSQKFNAAENERKWRDTVPTRGMTVASILARVPKSVLADWGREHAARSPRHSLEGFNVEDNRGAEGNGDKKGSKAKDAPPFIRNGNGHLAPIVANVLTELRSSSKWAVALDLFAGKEMLMEPLPDANGRKPNHFEPRPLEDGDIIRATEWFQRNGFQTMKKEAVADGLSVFAAENAFDPLVDHLRSLKWDGVGRLDTWLTYYCGAEPSPDQPAEYIAAAGLRWMISAVARALSPGCKVDTALVLVGKQGVGKSTVGKILAYRDEWFSDALPPVHSKEASDHIRGKWLIEFGEMATHSRSDAEEFKAFMTRREEKFRPPYGRKEIEYPRRCVFFGTTNRDAFLKDDTGNRRFWPVVVTKTDFAALEDEVNQLWAEAVWMFDQGERWHLDAAEAALAAGQQEAFMIVDERAEKLRNLITGRSQITALEALGLLGMEDDKREQMDVGSMLRSIGWRRSRTGRVRFWLPPVTTSVVTSESGGHADEGSEF